MPRPPSPGSGSSHPLPRIPAWASRHGIFYGWFIVGVSFTVLSLAFGVRLSFSVFFEALTRSGELAWSRADTAGVFSITMVLALVLTGPVGWLLDRLGPGRVYLLGLGLLASGLVLTSRVQTLPQFYLAYGVWTGAGIAVLGLAIHAATISRWFSSQGRRGLAIGLAFSGTGMGILVLAPMVERIIALHGWRIAYLALAGLVALVGFPVVWLFLHDTPQVLGLWPEGVGPDPPGSPSGAPQGTAAASGQEVSWTWSQAARTGSFWLLLAAGTFSLFTLRMVTVHQVAYLVDRGIPRLTAAAVLGMGGLVTAVSFALFGQLSDRIGREGAFYLGSLAHILALSVLLSLRADTPPVWLYLYPLLWGMGEGSRSSLLSAMASDTFRGPALGAIVGSLGAAFGLGAATGSWLGGWIYDRTGSYTLAFLTALLSTLVAAGCVFAAHRIRPRAGPMHRRPI